MALISMRRLLQNFRTNVRTYRFAAWLMERFIPGSSLRHVEIRLLIDCPQRLIRMNTYALAT